MEKPLCTAFRFREWESVFVVIGFTYCLIVVLWITDNGFPTHGTALNWLIMILYFNIILIFPIVGKIVCPYKLLVNEDGIHYDERKWTIRRLPKIFYTEKEYYSWEAISSFYLESYEPTNKLISRMLVLLDTNNNVIGRINLEKFRYSKKRIVEAIENASKGKCVLNLEEDSKDRKERKRILLWFYITFVIPLIIMVLLIVC